MEEGEGQGPPVSHHEPKDDELGGLSADAFDDEYEYLVYVAEQTQTLDDDDIIREPGDTGDSPVNNVEQSENCYNFSPANVASQSSTWNDDMQLASQSKSLHGFIQPKSQPKNLHAFMQPASQSNSVHSDIQSDSQSKVMEEVSQPASQIRIRHSDTLSVSKTKSFGTQMQPVLQSKRLQTDLQPTYQSKCFQTNMQPSFHSKCQQTDIQTLTQTRNLNACLSLASQSKCLQTNIQLASQSKCFQTDMQPTLQSISLQTDMQLASKCKSLQTDIHPTTESKEFHTSVQIEHGNRKTIAENSQRQCDLMVEHNAIMKEQCRLHAESNVIQTEIVKALNNCIRATTILNTTMTNVGMVNKTFCRQLIGAQEMCSQNWQGLTSAIGSQEKRNTPLQPVSEECTPVSEESSSSPEPPRVGRARTRSSKKKGVVKKRKK
ncbi:uncharacterized protein [Ambystoma mexicanum]|uniref:uncharacterized protein n=1 Tax=Ambystoma mexicanum TaxID=8296 RepID=UPI0037E700C1